MSTNISDQFGKHLRSHVDTYYPHMQGQDVKVEQVSLSQNKASIMHRFKLETEETQQIVLVKRPREQGFHERLAKQTEPEIKFRLEYDALASLHDHFSNLQDHRFGTIRTLDYLPQHCAIVMEESTDRTLSRIFANTSRFRRKATQIPLDAVCQNAGTWLRHFSQITPRSDVEQSITTRAEFVESLNTPLEYLVDNLGGNLLFQHIQNDIIQQAKKLLPEDLPLGLKHGDFAMRNMLVNTSGRVTVLDTQAKMLTPVYEDIAYFLVELASNGIQMMSQGIAYPSQDINNYQANFLHGYFEEAEIPYDIIRLFEIKMILGKWASKHYLLNKKSAGLRYRLRPVLEGWVNRFFREYLKNVVVK